MKQLVLLLLACFFLLCSSALADNVPNAKLARGNIWRGNSSGISRPYAASDNGKILIGDGTDLNSVSLSQDIAVTSAGVVSVNTLRPDVAETNLTTSLSDHTMINFTQQPQVVISAKTTMAIVTAVNAQQDFFRVGSPVHYFELTQGVGATGANTLLAANGLTPAATGWLLTLDNTATDSLEITEGIVSGSSRSYITGTNTAVMTVVFLVPTRTTITHLGIGFRQLGAYATANTSAEWIAAYDEKAMIGIKDNAGTLATRTSKVNVDVDTALAHAPIVNGDVVALRVSLAANGAVTYSLSNATPAGASYAQTNAALTAALAALAADVNAVAFTFTAATEVVPSIIIGASAAGAPDIRLVYYRVGST